MLNLYEELLNIWPEPGLSIKMYRSNPSHENNFTLKFRKLVL